MKNMLSFVVPALLVALLPAAAGAEDFDSAGVKIHYVVEGKGEPVVLIHGLHASARMNWQLPGVFAPLAERYQVLAMDVRGHGESDKPEAEDQYGLPMVEDVTRLLDHLKIDKAHLVGYSMGGMITLKFVALHPERVRSAVLGGMGWLRSGGLLERFWEKAGRGIGSTPEACVKGLGKLGLTEEEVAGVKVPVSMIVGDRDPCRMLYVEPLRKARPDWPVEVVDGAGHMNCIVKPEFKEKLLAALEKNAAPAPGGKK
ncbi:MAG: alpha/beta hydrolase [Planctomycetes bacterium]|nr:alpha/beta hydrolase [Planctomycetota bacterium]